MSEHDRVRVDDDVGKGYLRDIAVAVCSVLITGLLGGGIYLLIERTSSVSTEEMHREIDNQLNTFFEQRIKKEVVQQSEIASLVKLHSPYTFNEAFINDKFQRLFIGLDNIKSIDVDLRQLTNKVNRCETMIEVLEAEIKKKEEEGG
jgi:hypothetical protein